jgi:hypothetical protein
MSRLLATPTMLPRAATGYLHPWGYFLGRASVPVPRPAWLPAPTAPGEAWLPVHLVPSARQGLTGYGLGLRRAGADAGRSSRAGSRVRSESGLKPFSTPHSTACVRVVTPILR